jgi:hypothetical protein
VVERSLALLYQPGGLLYKPSITQPPPCIGELEIKSLTVLKRVLSHCQNLSSASILVLHVERIGPAPSSHPYTLDSVARDFLAATRRANKTDLVTRGPLELKSPSVVAPQIVLDEDVSVSSNLIGYGCLFFFSLGISSSFYWSRMWIHTRCHFLQAYVRRSVSRSRHMLT